VKARIVSMPCMELFFEQDEAYRETVIPSGAKKISIEAGITMGWERVIGTDGLAIGRDDFGASAPIPQLEENFGFTPDKVAARIKAWA